MKQNRIKTLLKKASMEDPTILGELNIISNKRNYEINIIR